MRKLLPGQMVVHSEALSLPLWANVKLTKHSGRVGPGQPLLVIQVDELALYANTTTHWALVTNGSVTGWLPTPIERLTVLDEGDSPVQSART